MSMAQNVDSKQALRLLPQDYASVEVEQIAEDQATRIQAQAEGVELDTDGKTLTRCIEFEGEKFRIADSVGLMPLMEFAYHAKSGMDTGDMEALAAIYEILKDCISDKPREEDGPTEWDIFRSHAKRTKADAEKLMSVVQQTVELLTARPTVQESGSSPQSRQTSDSWTDTSSGQRDQLVPVGELGRLASLG